MSVAAIYSTIVLVTLVTHGFNAFHVPYLEDDEGSYTAYAWAVSHLGGLGPYHTYFYEHPPLAWIQLAIWQAITGGVHAFGYAIASGRALMVVLSCGSSILVYRIASRVTHRRWLGVLACALYTLTPWALFTGRQVLLDNFAGFWMLAGFAPLIGSTLTLRRTCLSAIGLSFAVLSKEGAAAVLLAALILVVRKASPQIRAFAVTIWVSVGASIVSQYGVYALLKGEFFPSGTALGGSHPHVSLICTLEWQASRGRDGGILSPSSAFWHQVVGWATTMPILFGVGATCAILCTFLVRSVEVSAIGLSCVLFLIFLGRGGICLNFYILPILPFLAVATACSVAWVIGESRSRSGRRWGRLSPRRAAGVAAAIVCVGVTSVQLMQSRTELWQADPVSGQISALDWIERHVPARDTLVIDEYLWTDLHDSSSPGAPVHPRAQYYWKVAEDPEVQRRFGFSSWRNIDYIVVTPQLLSDTTVNGFPIIRQALWHSHSVAKFDTGLSVDIRRVSPRFDGGIVLPAAEPYRVPSCMTWR